MLSCLEGFHTNFLFSIKGVCDTFCRWCFRLSPPLIPTVFWFTQGPDFLLLFFSYMFVKNPTAAAICFSHKQPAENGHHMTAPDMLTTLTWLPYCKKNHSENSIQGLNSDNLFLLKLKPVTEKKSHWSNVCSSFEWDKLWRNLNSSFKIFAIKVLDSSDTSAQR